eukprot:1192249-Prorocentrum_minimum.AAC.2
MRCEPRLQRPWPCVWLWVSLASAPSLGERASALTSLANRAVAPAVREDDESIKSMPLTRRYLRRGVD